MPKKSKFEGLAPRVDLLLESYARDIKIAQGLHLGILYNPVTGIERSVKDALACLLYYRVATPETSNQVIDYICAKLRYDREAMIQILFNNEQERDNFAARVTLPEPKPATELTVSDYYLTHIINSNLDL